MFDWELDVYWPAARTNLTLNRFMQTKSSLTTGSLSLETLRSHSTVRATTTIEDVMCWWALIGEETL